MKWETSTMRLQFDSETGIIEIRPHDGFKQPETLEHAKENIEVGFHRVHHIAKALVIEMPNHYINAEVTRYYRKHSPDVPMALVADSYFKRMMGNFILSLNTQKRPTKLFKNFEEAHQWLEKILEVNSIED